MSAKKSSGSRKPKPHIAGRASHPPKPDHPDLLNFTSLIGRIIIRGSECEEVLSGLFSTIVDGGILAHATHASLVSMDAKIDQFNAAFDIALDDGLQLQIRAATDGAPIIKRWLPKFRKAHALRNHVAHGVVTDRQTRLSDDSVDNRLIIRPQLFGTKGNDGFLRSKWTYDEADLQLIHDNLVAWKGALEILNLKIGRGRDEALARLFEVPEPPHLPQLGWEGRL